MLYVVLLAMVAAFLGLRLYMVLGKRTGHEQEVLPRAVEERAPPVQRPSEPAVEAAGTPFAGKAANGLRALVAADPKFDALEFVEGAKGAYRMVLEAYWQGDKDTLAWLCEPDVAKAFSEAIDVRVSAGETLDNRLVKVDRAAITNAGVERGVARVTVRFDADIAAATRDADGQLVSGSVTDAVEQHDVWTFTRTLSSTDPNWTLAETDED